MAQDTSNLTKVELVALIRSMEASQPKPRTITVKHSIDKPDGTIGTGSIVVSGLGGKYPISLYRTSWQRLLTSEVASLILSYISEHEAAITAQMIKAGKVDHVV